MLRCGSLRGPGTKAWGGFASMKIAMLKERRPGELRVAGSPGTVKRYVGLGLEVVVEAGAGLGASIPDDAYQGAGASIAADAGAVLGGADVVLKVQRPLLPDEGGVDELGLIRRGAVLIGTLAPHDAPESLAAYRSEEHTSELQSLMRNSYAVFCL